MKASRDSMKRLADIRYDRDLKRAEELHALADLVYYEYGDESRSDKIRENARVLRMEAMDHWINATPELRKLRHASAHSEGGVYYGVKCPQCKGDRWVAVL